MNEELQQPRRTARWDDRVLGLLMVVLGACRVVPAIVDGERWGAEVSLAALMTFIGCVLLIPRRT